MTDWTSLTDEEPREKELESLDGLLNLYRLQGGGLATVTTYSDSDEIRVSLSVFEAGDRILAHIVRSGHHPTESVEGGAMAIALVLDEDGDDGG